MRHNDKLIKRISGLSPQRKPVTVSEWFDSLGLTEYSHLFASYISMQVSMMDYIQNGDKPKWP